MSCTQYNIFRRVISLGLDAVLHSKRTAQGFTSEDNNLDTTFFENLKFTLLFSHKRQLICESNEICILSLYFSERSYSDVPIKQSYLKINFILKQWVDKQMPFFSKINGEEVAENWIY
jgi:hypothetical protein